jgi:glycosyltransferase involved in cell wall biosynthesis
MKKVVFVAPMYNASPHLPELVDSLKEQNNENWELVVIDDMSTDDSIEMLNICKGNDERISFIKNKEKKWALKNVVETARIYQDKSDVIIAILDADDSLCNENTVEKILKMYCEETDTVWTAHTWDINGLNISKSLPEKVNPYQFPWVSSHLKTFRASILKSISDENFKDLDGNWFQRGYDQAIYLPMLYISRKRKYLNEICYLYRINSNSMKNRDWKEKSQLDTVKLVRARGYIKNV